MGTKLKTHKTLKLPSKKTMNLYQVEITDNSWQRVMPYALLIIVFVVAFTKFGVFQRVSQLDELKGQVSKAQSQLDELNKSLEDYDDVKSEYVRYSNHYMLEEEGKLVDRTSIIALIGDKVSNIGEVKSYAIADNTVSLEVIVGKLDDVRMIRKQLEVVDWVGNITVNTATKTVTSTGMDQVVASIVFDVIFQGEFEAPAGISGSAESGEGVDD